MSSQVPTIQIISSDYTRKSLSRFKQQESVNTDTDKTHRYFFQLQNKLRSIGGIGEAGMNKHFATREGLMIVVLIFMHTFSDVYL